MIQPMKIRSIKSRSKVRLLRLSKGKIVEDLHIKVLYEIFELHNFTI